MIYTTVIYDNEIENDKIENDVKDINNCNNAEQQCMKDQGQEYEYGLECPVNEFAVRLLENVCSILECEYEAECSLVITGPDAIRELNNEYRGIDSVTDVLSFPAINFDYPCNYDIIDENDPSMFNPDSGELILGDIVICHDRVLSQAEEYGHSAKREFSFLIVHSLLHLFGYDHIEEEDRVLMENMQRDILDKLDIRR